MHALALHREVEPLLRRVGDRPWLAWVLNNQGVFLAALGRPDDALVAYHEAVRLLLATDNHAEAANALTNCAEVHLDQGRTVEAQDALAQARALLQALPDPPPWIVQWYQSQVARVKDETGLG